MNLEPFEEQLFFCTVRIVVPMEQEHSVGTGFIVQAPVDEKRNVILLVSNKHVFKDNKYPIDIAFHKRKDDSEYSPALGNVSGGLQRVDEGSYTAHPDPNVDLACVNVSPIGNPDLGIYYRTLDLSMSALFDESWIKPFTEVCFVGYPDGRYDTVNHLPILRGGKIASIPRTDFNGAKQLIIDGHVHKGSSGSPVFAMPPPYSGESAKFLGVLTRTMIRGERLQLVSDEIDLGINLTIGLGFVLKAELVKELVEIVVSKYRPVDPVESAGSEPIAINS
jgi:Trypsin-like peptidase domain